MHCCSSAVVAQTAQSLTPLASFGNTTPGWRQPGEPLPADVAGTNDGISYLYMQVSNNERGLAYGNGHLYLVSHANVNGSSTNVRVLDALTGADTGGLDATGISGGTFAVNAAAVGTDGAIYVGNLTSQSTTSPFKIYKWATEASTPSCRLQWRRRPARFASGRFDWRLWRRGRRPVLLPVSATILVSPETTATR